MNGCWVDGAAVPAPQAVSVPVSIAKARTMTETFFIQFFIANPPLYDILNLTQYLRRNLITCGTVSRSPIP